MESGEFNESCLQACFVGQALDGMCIGMVLTNPAGRVTWMNRAAYGILGIEPGQESGRILGQVLRDPNLTEFWHRAREGGEHVMGEISIRWPRRAELKANFTLCRTPRGREIGQALLFCDVTSDRAVQLELTKEAAERLAGLADGPVGGEAVVAGLTQQELKVLRLVGEGYGNQDISRELHVAASTVRSHLKSIYRKTNLASRADAVRFAIRSGLVQA